MVKRMTSSTRDMETPPHGYGLTEEKENRMPSFYAKELGQEKPQYPQLRESLEKSQEEQYNEVEGSNTENQSYNKWKNKNHHLFRNEVASDMVSSLGKKLETQNKFMMNHSGGNGPFLNEERTAQGYLPPPRNEPWEPTGYQERRSLDRASSMQYIKLPEDVQFREQNHLTNTYYPMAYSAPFPLTPGHQPRPQSFLPKRVQCFGYTSDSKLLDMGGKNPYHNPGYEYDHYNKVRPCYENIQPSPVHKYMNPQEVHHYSTPKFSHNGNNMRPFQDVRSTLEVPLVPQTNNYVLRQSGDDQSRTACTVMPLDDQCRCRHCPSTCECRSGKSEASRSKSKEKTSQKSLKNLYRIVWLQNEQLALLQKQIDKMLSDQKNSPAPDTNPKNKEEPPECKDATPKSSKKDTRSSVLSPVLEKSLEASIEKTSVGVMTSFITKNKEEEQNTDFCQCCGIKTCNPTCPENDVNSSEESSDDEDVDLQERLSKEDSFALHGINIPTVQEQMTTPQASLHLDIQEYKSSNTSSSSSDVDRRDSSEDEAEEDEPVSRNWGLSDNAQMGNNLKFKENGLLKQDSVEDIRNATFDQLRQLGVSIIESESQGQKRVTFDPVRYQRFDLGIQQKQVQSDSDTSMHINALAMKYLKGDKKTASVGDRMQGMTLCNIANGNTNLSFATMRYLERYQLFPTQKPSENHCVKEPREVPKEKTKKEKKKRNSPANERQRKFNRGHILQHQGKILDVSAIKQQPKLLPKT